MYVYAVLFDIDGTLLHTGGAGQLAFADAFESEFGVGQLSGEVAFAGRSDRAIAYELMGVHDVPATETNWQRFRHAYLRRLPDALKLRRGRVLPGVLELLDALDLLEHPVVGLLTGNLEQGAACKLAHYGLGHRFGFGGFGDSSHDRCDIAAAALREAERFAAGRAAPGNGRAIAGAMVIGDTVHDIACARSIQAYAVAVPTGNTPADQLAAANPDLLLDDLTDPRPVLERVRAAMQATGNGPLP